MPKLRHYDGLGNARFITFCCYHRYHLLSYDELKNIFIECLKQILNKYNIRIFGYVLMPEHVHLVLLPLDDIKLGLVIGELKSNSAHSSIKYLKQTGHRLIKKIMILSNGNHRYTFWQKRCYDHNCRTQETTIEKINYCHKNPVSRGLVVDPGEYIWSSYNYYQGVKEVPIQMDEM